MHVITYLDMLDMDCLHNYGHECESNHTDIGIRGSGFPTNGCITVLKHRYLQFAPVQMWVGWLHAAVVISDDV